MPGSRCCLLSWVRHPVIHYSRGMQSMPTLSRDKEEPGALSHGQDTCKGCRFMCRRRVGQRYVARFLLIVVLLSLSVLGSTGLPAYAEARDGLNCNPWGRIASPGA